MSYEIFKNLCESRGVKPSDITKATGITSATFTSWKQGKYTPKADKLQLIADYFGVPFEYLITGEINKGYYLDSSVAKIAQELVESPGRRTLFDMTRGMSEERLDKVCRFIQEYMQDDNNEGGTNS